MKVININSNNTNSSETHEIIKPISIKMTQNFFDDCNIIIPSSLSEKEIEGLKEKNKWFFYEYSKIYEKNYLLKYKLQDLLNKKNEIHKYIIQLEHKKDKNAIDIDKNININNSNNNSISQELSNFQSNIYINRKRKRRKKSQIVYKYKCNFSNCNKKYATEGALNQHIKIKHS